MQITQIAANKLKHILCFTLFFMSLTLSARIELFDDYDLAPPKDVAPKKGITIITRVEGKYAFQRDDSTFAIGVYDQISRFRRTGYLVTIKGKFGLTNKKGALIIPVEYDSISFLNKNHSTDILVTKGNKYGMMNDSGTVILPLKYCEIYYGNSSSELYLVRDKKGRLKLLAGAALKPIKDIEKLTFFKDGAIIEEEGKFGFIYQGGITVLPIYDKIELGSKTLTISPLVNETYFKSQYSKRLGCLIVIKEGKKGLIKGSGETIFEPEFDVITFDKQRGIYKLKKEKKWGVYVPIHDTKLDAVYDRVYTDGRSYITLTKEGKQGIFDYKGNTIFPCEYSSIRLQSNGDFLIKKNGKAGMYKKSGEEIFPVIYDNIKKINFIPELKNHYEVTLSGLKGIVTPDTVIVPIKFEYVFDLNNYFIVQIGDSVGAYNFQGRKVLPPIYDWVYKSKLKGNEILIARKDGELSIIDQSENPVLLDHLKAIRYINNSYNLNNPITENKTASFLSVQHLNKKWGVFDEHGKKLGVPIIYDSIHQKIDFKKITYFIVLNNGKMGLINSKNEVLIPLEYQSLNVDFCSIGFIKDPNQLNIVAQKKGKYGLINLENKTVLPFQYSDLARISFEGLYKAKTKGGYKIINSQNELIHKGPFDNVGNLDNKRILTFKAGQMRMVNEAGQYISEDKPMTYHEGYKTFDALKKTLILCLNNADDELLFSFAQRITPSKHLLYLFSKTSHTKAYLEYSSPKKITKRYYQVLLEIKRVWNSGRYDQSKLTDVEEYTSYDGQFYSNKLKKHQTYGNQELEWILGDAVRLDGFWVSTFFLKHRY